MSGNVKTLYASDGQTPWEIEEGTTMSITGTFYDESDAAIALSAISAFTFTLYDVISREIINSRNAVNVLNASIGVVTSSGVFTLRLTVDDAIIVGCKGDDVVEAHRAQLKWTWNDGTADRTDMDEYEFGVRNLPTLS